MPANRQRFTAKLIKDISDFFFEGFNNDDISFYFGLPLDLVVAIRTGSKFTEIRKAVINRKHLLIAKALSGKKLSPATVWFLERRFPTEWSKPETQLGLVNTGSVNNTLVVTAELAERLLERSKPVEDELTKLLKERDQRSLLTEVSKDELAEVSSDVSKEEAVSSSKVFSEDGHLPGAEREGHPLPVPPPPADGHPLPPSGENPKISVSRKNCKISENVIKRKPGRPKKKV